MSVAVQTLLAHDSEAVQSLPVLQEGTTMRFIPGRCFACRRILFPKPDGTVPYHRVPPEVRMMPARGTFGSVPLTGLDADWCRGGGQKAVA